LGLFHCSSYTPHFTYSHPMSLCVIFVELFTSSCTPFFNLCTSFNLCFAAIYFFSAPPCYLLVSHPFLFWTGLLLLCATHIPLHTPLVTTYCTPRFTNSTIHLCFIVNFGHVLYFTCCTPIFIVHTWFTSWTSHITHTPLYFCFSLLSLF